MALPELVNITSLLSIVAVLLLLHHHPPSRLLCPGAAFADLLLAALDRFVDGRGLLDLATRRNMILLCHAILLLILRDAGILGAPARRCAPATTSTAAAVTPSSGACHYSQEQRSHGRTVVAWSPPPNRATANAAVAGGGRLLIKRQRQGARMGDAAAPRAEPEPAPAEPEQVGAPPVAIKDIVVVEERGSNYLLDHHRAAAGVDHELQAAPVNGDQSSALHFGREIIIADDDEKDAGAGEETAGVELADDRRFEEFIANTRRTMRLESLKLVTKLSSRQGRSMLA